MDGRASDRASETFFFDRRDAPADARVFRLSEKMTKLLLTGLLGRDDVMR